LALEKQQRAGLQFLLELFQKRQTAISCVVAVVSPMQTHEEKALQLNSVERRSAEFPEKVLSSGHILIQKRGFETLFLENLTHDGGERIYQVVFDVKTSRAEGPRLFCAALEPHSTVDSTEGGTSSKLVLNK
jgi:hypothetical protein